MSNPDTREQDLRDGMEYRRREAEKARDALDAALHAEDWEEADRRLSGFFTAVSALLRAGIELRGCLRGQENAKRCALEDERNKAHDARFKPMARELRESGQTFAAIAAELNGRGFTTRSNTPWTGGSVRELLLRL